MEASRQHRFGVPTAACHPSCTGSSCLCPAGTCVHAAAHRSLNIFGKQRNELAQRVKALGAKPGNLGAIPEAHTVEAENRLLRVVL